MHETSQKPEKPGGLPAAGAVVVVYYTQYDILSL